MVKSIIVMVQAQLPLSLMELYQPTRRVVLHRLNKILGADPLVRDAEECLRPAFRVGELRTLLLGLSRLHQVSIADPRAQQVEQVGPMVHR
jgi:hypothetical protein